MSGNERQCKVGSFILEYVERELAFVNEGESHNASSDPVESIFGVVKDRMSDDKLAGVTPIILMMPLRLNLADKDRRVNFNFLFIEFYLPLSIRKICRDSTHKYSIPILLTPIHLSSNIE
jgi:hypothetical protein